MYIERAILKQNLQNIIRDPLPASRNAVTEAEGDLEVEVEAEAEAEAAARDPPTITNESTEAGVSSSIVISENDQRSNSIGNTVDPTPSSRPLLSTSSPPASLASSASSPLSISSTVSPLSSPTSSPSNRTSIGDKSAHALDDGTLENGDVELSGDKTASTTTTTTNALQNNEPLSKDTKIDNFLHLYDNLATFDENSPSNEIKELANPAASPTKSADDQFGEFGQKVLFCSLVFNCAASISIY